MWESIKTTVLKYFKSPCILYAIFSQICYSVLVFQCSLVWTNHPGIRYVFGFGLKLNLLLSKTIFSCLYCDRVFFARVSNDHKRLILLLSFLTNQDLNSSNQSEKREILVSNQKTINHFFVTLCICWYLYYTFFENFRLLVPLFLLLVNFSSFR